MHERPVGTLISNPSHPCDDGPCFFFLDDRWSTEALERVCPLAQWQISVIKLRESAGGGPGDSQGIPRHRSEPEPPGAGAVDAVSDRPKWLSNAICILHACDRYIAASGSVWPFQGWSSVIRKFRRRRVFGTISMIATDEHAR